MGRLGKNARKRAKQIAAMKELYRYGLYVQSLANGGERKYNVIQVPKSYEPYLGQLKEGFYTSNVSRIIYASANFELPAGWLSAAPPVSSFQATVDAQMEAVRQQLYVKLFFGGKP